MKNKALLTVILLMIAVFTGFIYERGDTEINEASLVGFSTFSFVEKEAIAKSTEDIPKIVEIEIENFDNDDREYDISFQFEGQEFFASSVLVRGGRSAKVSPAKEALSAHGKLEPETKQEVEVVIKWDDKKEKLSKEFLLTK